MNFNQIKYGRVAIFLNGVGTAIGSFLWGTATDKNWGQSTTQLWGIGPPGFNFRSTDNGTTRIVYNGVTRIID